MPTSQARWSIWGQLGLFPTYNTISKKFKPIPIRGADYDIGWSPLDLKMFRHANFPMNYRDSC